MSRPYNYVLGHGVKADLLIGRDCELTVDMVTARGTQQVILRVDAEGNPIIAIDSEPKVGLFITDFEGLRNHDACRNR